MGFESVYVKKPGPSLYGCEGPGSVQRYDPLRELFDSTTGEPWHRLLSLVSNPPTIPVCFLSHRSFGT